MSEKPKATHRGDYQPPDYFIDRVDLEFELDESATRVRATLQVRRNPALQGDPPPFVLNGEELATERVAIDGEAPFLELPDTATLPGSKCSFSAEAAVMARISVAGQAQYWILWRGFRLLAKRACEARPSSAFP